MVAAGSDGRFVNHINAVLLAVIAITTSPKRPRQQGRCSRLERREVYQSFNWLRRARSPERKTVSALQIAFWDQEEFLAYSHQSAGVG